MIPRNGTSIGSRPGPGAAPEMLSPYPRELNVKDPTRPFVMFPGKPNEHLMIPVHSQELAAVSGGDARERRCALRRAARRRASARRLQWGKVELGRTHKFFAPI
jgi:hypothetical protein